MPDRLSLRVLLFIGLALPIAGCTNPLVDGITVAPLTQSVPVGQSTPFTATGTFGHGSHPSTTQDVTAQVAWSSSSPTVATIVSSTGVATGVAAGTTTITATINGYGGILTASAALTVTGSAGGGTGTVSGITSISVTPATVTVAGPGSTAPFTATGTSSTGSTTDLTTQVAWTSGSSQIATIVANTGVATAVAQGTATITATYTNPGGGAVVAGNASFTVTSGSAGTGAQYTAVKIVPTSQTVSASAGTANFIALATLASNGLQADVTNSPNITWLSSIPAVATVVSGATLGNGVVKGASVGTSYITVELANTGGSLVTDTATADVALTPPPEPILSLNIIPSEISVNDFQLTGQFLAIATYSSFPYVQDVTNDPNTTWISTEPEMFPVDTNSGGGSGASAGLVTAYGSGGAVIVAEVATYNPNYTQPTIQTATTQFSCPLVLPTPTTAGSCYPGEPLAPTLLETLTIYNEGLNTKTWEITAPSATGTANVIHCGPGWTGAGGSVCTATYPTGTVVTLTSPAGAGAFGGWSFNCTPVGAVTALGPNTCQVTLTTNDTVGAIIN